MQVIQSPLPRQPHVCAVTGRDDGDVLDTNIQIKGIDPHLYLRVTVIEEMAKAIGMVPKAEVDKLEQGLSTLAEDLVEAQRRIAAYEQVEAGLAELKALTDDTTDSEPVPTPA